jgi:hypothetical protein
LNEDQLTTLFGQLFKAGTDANGNPILSDAYNNPATEAQTVIAADNYLIALRAGTYQDLQGNNASTLDAFNYLFGQTFQNEGPLSDDQLTLLFGQLFTETGDRSKGYNDPMHAVQDVGHAANFFIALQATSYTDLDGNTWNNLNAFNELTGLNIQPGVALTQDQLATLFADLYTTQANPDGTVSIVPTEAYFNPMDAAANWGTAANYLTALRANNGAGLDALKNLTGLDFPPSGKLTPDEIAALMGLLFTNDANGKTVPTLANTMPAQATDLVTHASAFLDSLRKTSGALDALKYLLGMSFPGIGEALDVADIGFLFAQLFHDDGQLQDANGNYTRAYADPQQAAVDFIKADDYLTALRATPGALDAVNDIFGLQLPSDGKLDPDPTQNTGQLKFIMGQLYASDGSTAMAYNEPAKASTATVHADAFLKALRTTPNALAQLQFVFGVTFPPSGYLTDKSQIEKLFGFLFNKDGSYTLAFTDPQAFVNTLVGKQSTASVRTVLPTGALHHVPVLHQTSGGVPSVGGLTQRPSPPSQSSIIQEEGSQNEIIQTIESGNSNTQVIGDLTPSKAYRSLVGNQSAVGAQMGWLAASDALQGNVPAATKALQQASAANKNVSIKSR